MSELLFSSGASKSAKEQADTNTCLIRSRHVTLAATHCMAFPFRRRGTALIGCSVGLSELFCSPLLAFSSGTDADLIFISGPIPLFKSGIF